MKDTERFYEDYLTPHYLDLDEGLDGDWEDWDDEGPETDDDMGMDDVY